MRECFVYLFKCDLHKRNLCTIIKNKSIILNKIAYETLSDGHEKDRCYQAVLAVADDVLFYKDDHKTVTPGNAVKSACSLLCRSF